MKADTNDEVTNVLRDILKNSKYSLAQFDESYIEQLKNKVFSKDSKSGAKYYVECIKRNKEILLNPEEIIRQLFLIKLVEHYKYPIERIAIESPVQIASATKRADIVVFDKDRPTIPYIIIELKHPNSKRARSN